VAEPHLMKDTQALSNGTGGVWRIEAVLHRIGGDIDVIVSYQTYGEDKRYSGYRAADGGWRRLNAAWRDLGTAREEIGAVLGYAVLEDLALIELLDLARDGAE
jgi:hypothetical protein